MRKVSRLVKRVLVTAAVMVVHFCVCTPCQLLTLLHIDHGCLISSGSEREVKDD